jgi:hypothetical protein
LTLPNFLIVGAQKAGTTSLHAILAAHPETNMSEVKEVNYFINNDKFKRGLAFYSSFFEDKDAIATGESSPGYISHPGVAERIKQNLGDIKIIIMLRDPIKRAFSQYWDNRRRMGEWMSEGEIVKHCLEERYLPSRRGYFSRGVYAPQVEHYFSLFGKENVKTIFLEELVSKQETILKDIYSFLSLDINQGLSQLPPAENASQIWNNPLYTLFFKNPGLSRYLPKRARRFLFFGHKEKYKYPKPSSETLQRLNDFYKPHNKELVELLGRKLPW